MQIPGHIISLGVILGGMASCLTAGPYSAASNDPANSHDAPVPGFTGPDGIGMARLNTFSFDANGDPIYENPDNFVNPVFFAWAESVADYQPSEFVSSQYADSTLALGPVTGDNFDIVSLGDLGSAAITGGSPPGTVTLQFSKPIKNLSGADFVVFENGHIAQSNQGGAGTGGVFGELAYVEVSANGTDFVRFPATSLTTAAVGAYGSIDPTNVDNLAGKHINAFGASWGTPFDLAQVGLTQITHIRLVDIPGNGAFTDHTGHPIYDAWKTTGSGGFDLEAVGAISTAMTFDGWPQLATLPEGSRGQNDDPDGDGLPNLLEYAFARVPGVPDAAGATPTIRIVSDGNAGFPELSFLRDERLTDLVYEVQVSSSPSAGNWTTLAQSTAGGLVLPANGHLPVIAETSAPGIASVQVVRQVTVRDEVSTTASSPRFFRVKVSSVSAPIPNP